jgi:uncharacterized protein YbaR (Trm112 family)
MDTIGFFIADGTSSANVEVRAQVGVIDSKKYCALIAAVFLLQALAACERDIAGGDAHRNQRIRHASLLPLASAMDERCQHPNAPDPQVDECIVTLFRNLCPNSAVPKIEKLIKQCAPGKQHWVYCDGLVDQLTGITERPSAPVNCHIGKPKRVSADLLEILADPGDKGPLTDTVDESGREWLVNPRNGYRYPVKDGVPVMLLEEGAKNRIPPTGEGSQAPQQGSAER